MESATRSAVKASAPGSTVARSAFDGAACNHCAAPSPIIGCSRAASRGNISREEVGF